MTTSIAITEATYVDERAGNDKFYRTFAFGSSWVTQYGRNGTMGTFTKIVAAASPEAAEKAAAAKFTSKVKKGYTPSRSGVVPFAGDINADSLGLLDGLADQLPAGGTHTIVTKTVAAVDLGATRAADRTAAVSLRLAGEFTARPVIGEDLSPALPMRPMLASSHYDDVIAAVMEDPEWVAQFKYDGDRVVIEVRDGHIRVLNRQGEEKVRNVSPAHLVQFSALHSGRWVFDGEIVGRTLVLFDLAAAADTTHAWVRESDGFLTRYRALTEITDALGIPSVAYAPESAPVVCAPLADEDEKHDYLERAACEQREGIILRHRNGPYEPARRSTFLLKHKLVKDADVVVTSLHETKDSATVSVYDERGVLHEVGNVSTIGKGRVTVGDVWMATFLYVTDPANPRMVQPRLTRKRADKAAAECTITQFVGAGTVRAV